MSKNRLQEYFQKKKGKMPEYTTMQFTPEPNLTWKSTVKIFILDKDHTFEGEADKSKTAAEISAASKALEWLNTKPDSGKKVLEPPRSNSKPASPDAVVEKKTFIKSEVPIILSDQSSGLSKYEKQIVIILDVENMPKLIEELVPLLEVYDNIHVYAFSGEHASQTKVLDGIDHPRINKIISASTRKDGTDTCIQLHCGMFLYDETFDIYIVCTRDHYGGTLVEFIQTKDLAWPPKEAYLATSMEHINRIMRTLQL